MKKSLKIALLSVPQNLPLWCYAPDGNVYLDIDRETILNKTKSASALNDINKISGSAILGFKLLNSNKNDLILGEILEPAKFILTNTYFIEVNAFEGAICLNQNIIEVISKGDGYECELSDKQEHWKYLIEGRTLNELNYPVIRLTEEWLTEQWTAGESDPEDWTDAHLLTDDHIGVYFSIWHNGNWREKAATYNEDDELTEKGEIGVVDLVPVWHIQRLLEKIFCLDGWSFRCDALNTRWGRSLAAKLLINLDEDIPVESFGFRAVVKDKYIEFDFPEYNPSYWADTLYIQAVDDNEDGYDAGEGDDISGYYTGYDFETETPVYKATGLSGKFSFRSLVKLSTVDWSTKIYWEYWLIVNGQVENVFSGNIIDQSTGEKFFEYELNLMPTDEVQVYTINRFSYGTTGIYTVMPGTYWELKPIEVTFTEGVIINLSHLLPKDNSMNLIKAFANIIGQAKITTDWITKTVTFYPPHTTQVYGGNTAVGFYKSPERAVDVSEMIICDTEVDYTPEATDFREIIVSFKATSDAYAKSKGFGKESRPYGRKIVSNPFAPAGTEKFIENIYFEPTINIFADDVKVDKYLPIEIPASWDNSNYEVSKKHTPRIVSIVGYVRQFGSTDGNVIEFRKYYWKGEEKEFFPWVTQLSYQGVGEQNVRHDLNVVYGVQNYDLWDFWEKDFYDRLFGIPVDFDAIITDAFFDKTDFRDYVRVYAKGRELTLKLEQISGFKSNASSPSKLKLLSPYQRVQCEVEQSSAVRQYMRCDFYMDFGEWLSNETLGYMMLVKFDVNGQDYIGGADLPLGNNVTFANGNYPTNLPDFLNGLGIPGFTFGYANFRRKRFSIQFPVGTEFEFIIENTTNGQDMYRWTHEHQSQGTFFGLASWTVYAYADNPYPENCIIVEQ